MWERKTTATRAKEECDQTTSIGAEKGVEKSDYQLNEWAYLFVPRKEEGLSLWGVRAGVEYESEYRAIDKLKST